MRSILFLCSGHSYRSRYAEILFNQLAEKQQLDWRAKSASLIVDWLNHPITPSAELIAMLSDHAVVIPADFPAPIQVLETDFAAADLLIALHQEEHRPIFQARFPEWEDEVEYWEIQDTKFSSNCEWVQQLTAMIVLLLEDLREVSIMAY